MSRCRKWVDFDILRFPEMQLVSKDDILYADDVEWVTGFKPGDKVIFMGTIEKYGIEPNTPCVIGDLPEEGTVYPMLNIIYEGEVIDTIAIKWSDLCGENTV